MMQSNPPPARYLNVDLEIRSRTDLQPLADALADSTFLLHCGMVEGVYLAAFETKGVTLDPDRAIRKLALLLQACPPSVRTLWRRADDRVFDIGIEASNVPGTFELALKPSTVRMVAELRARIKLTVYHHAPRP